MQPGRACRTHGRRRRKVLLLCGDVRLTTAPKLRSLMLRQLATTPAAQHDHARRIIAHSIITATCRPTTATQTHALQSCDCCTLPVHMIVQQIVQSSTPDGDAKITISRYRTSLCLRVLYFVYCLLSFYVCTLHSFLLRLFKLYFI